jgi:hypothetical protein
VVVAKDREVGAERWQLVFLAVAVEVDAATGRHHVASLVRLGVAPQHGAAGGRRGGRGSGGGVSRPDEQHAREHRGEYPHTSGRHEGAGCCRWQWRLAHADARRKEAFLSSEPGEVWVVVLLNETAAMARRRVRCAQA